MIITEAQEKNEPVCALTLSQLNSFEWRPFWYYYRPAT